MSWKNRFLPRFYFSPETGGSEAPATPESVLFPDEGTKPEDENKPDGENRDDAAKDAEADKGGDPKSGDDPDGKAGDKPEGKDDKPDDKGDDKGDKKGGDELLDQVPEDGKYELTMPEGVEVDTELLDAISPKLQAKGYTRREAQELTDEFIKVQQARAKAFTEKPEGAWSAVTYEFFKENGTPDTWAEKAKADKEIGGDNWDATVTNSRRFVQHAGSDDLKKLLNETGVGNHPELIRVFAKAGEMIREDDPPNGGAGGKGKPVDAASLLFPNDAPKG